MPGLPTSAATFAFNAARMDIIEEVVRVCSEVAEATGEQQDVADAVLARSTFPPESARVPVTIVHPDDDERFIEDLVEVALVPAATSAAMVRLIDRHLASVVLDEADQEEAAALAGEFRAFLEGAWYGFTVEW